MLTQISSLVQRLLSGVLGAFTAYTMVGFCMWFISVSPVFIPISYFLYFFSGPFLIGITAGFLFPKVSGGITALKVFLVTFVCTVVGEFLALIIVSFWDVSRIFEGIQLDRATIESIYFAFLEVGSGLLTMGILISIMSLWPKRKQMV